MAFLKMQFALWDSIKVEQIAGRVGEHPHRVIGALGAVWRWCSEQTEDGSAKVADNPELAMQWVDRKGLLPGLGAAMRSVGWLDVAMDGTLSIPKFETHIGSAKKARRSAAARMRKVRKKKSPSPVGVSGGCSPEHSGECSERVFHDSDSDSVSVSSKKKGGQQFTWPATLDTPEHRLAWDQWVAVRAEAWPNDPLGPIQTEALLKRLLGMGPASALVSLRTAAASGWKTPRTPDPEKPAQASTARSGGWKRNDPFEAPAPELSADDVDKFLGTGRYAR